MRSAVRGLIRRPNPVAAAPIAPAAPGEWLSGSVHHRAGTRSYQVYKPSDLSPRSRVPLVVLLHGCGQSAADFAAATRFNELADQHGFVVVYPQQSVWSHQQRCWHWYESGHQKRGAGEPAIIAEITTEVIAEADRWHIDASRVYVAGLSAGGGMAMILGAAYPDLFAAVGIHSAPAYRAAASGGGALAAMSGRAAVPPLRLHPDGGQGLPPAIVFQGADDTTVRPSNGPEITEQWLAYRQAYATQANGDAKAADRITRTRNKSGKSADGRAYAITSWYTARGRKLLEYWQVDGLGHAWSGGTAGGSYSDPLGPSASAAMWDFFSARR